MLSLLLTALWNVTIFPSLLLLYSVAPRPLPHTSRVPTVPFGKMEQRCVVQVVRVGGLGGPLLADPPTCGSDYFPGIGLPVTTTTPGSTYTACGGGGERGHGLRLLVTKLVLRYSVTVIHSNTGKPQQSNIVTLLPIIRLATCEHISIC